MHKRLASGIGVTMSNDHTVRTETYLREDIRNILKAIAIAGNMLEGDRLDGYMMALYAVAAAVGIDANRD